MNRVMKTEGYYECVYLRLMSSVIQRIHKDVREGLVNDVSVVSLVVPCQYTV